MRNAGTVAIVKESNYYPFGLTHQGYNNITTSLGSAGAKKYQYNGKELQDDYGLDWYDYGARFYDASLGRWFVQDAMAEKYYSNSPYHFSGNNPIKFVDIDGRDYGLHFDKKSKTIKISATYYATSSDISSANQSAAFFNNLSGTYTYTVGKGNASSSYTVVFDLKVVEVAVNSKIGEMGSLNVALGSDKSGEGNIYKVVSDSKLGDNTNGTTMGGNFIQVKDARRTTGTGAHEMGHTLGLVHNTSGLMTPSSTDSNHSNSVNKRDVKDMFKYPLKHKVNYDYDSKGNKVYAGKGTVTNNTSSTNNELKKGKLQ